MDYFKSKLRRLKEGENGTAETRNFWMSLRLTYLGYNLTFDRKVEELNENLFPLATEIVVLIISHCMLVVTTKASTNGLRTSNFVCCHMPCCEALQLVAESLSEVIDGLQTNLSGDLLALDIKPFLHYLGELTGEVTNEDQLDYIFSKFCIGK